MSTNEPMTQEQLDEIRERLSDVGAPWEFAPTPDGDGGEVIRVGEQGGPIAWGIDIDAAGLIANAPQDLAGLLAEVQRLRADNERLRALTTVTEDMVDRGVRAFYGDPTPGVDVSLRPTWDRFAAVFPGLEDSYRRRMTAALDAALGTGEATA